MSAYRSIFLEPDWAHTLYYGWREEEYFPAVKVLRKDVGPASRLLLLGETGDVDIAERALREAGHGPLREAVFHDFTGSLNDASLRGFQNLARDKWMLNAATFVIDLSADPDAILERMSADTKRRIRKADAAGVAVEVESHPPLARLCRFFGALREMQIDRGLHPVRTAPLERMFEEGRALLLSNETEGSSGGYLMLYRAGDKAIWLHGVGRGTTPDSGQLLQWRAIEALKQRGVRWYDLGGVPSDPASGIRPYKQGFGGDFVALGKEFASASPLVALARRLISR